MKAVDSVSFDIKKGEVFGLLGPNGAGKTTLISVLCGFLLPDKGKASIFGMDCGKDSSRIQKRMNFVSGFTGMMEFFTAEELLRFYCMLYGLGDVKGRVKRSLEATGLSTHAKRIAADFSSGLGRRFLISKALLNDPEVLLLDEPTVGLDVDSAYRMRDMIRGMKKSGTTILLTTHNMKEAEELCDRVALIREGKIIACGTFQELKKRFFPLEVLEIECKNPAKIEKAVQDKVVKTKKSKGSIKIYLKDKKSIDSILKLIASEAKDVLSINTVEPELEDLYTKVMRDA